MSDKAIFLDRDGVINEMVFAREHGFVDSPNNVKQFVMIKGVKKAIKIAKKLGFSVIIISNQPGIAKGYYSKKTFDKIREKMFSEFEKSKVRIDDDFYCLHHPEAKLIKYKKKCTCRKPESGLVKKAIKKHGLNIKKSYFIGDGLVDMQLAKKVGCRSIFVGNINTSITNLFTKKNIHPQYVAKDLLDAICFIKQNEGHS